MLLYNISERTIVLFTLLHLRALDYLLLCRLTFKTYNEHTKYNVLLHRTLNHATVNKISRVSSVLTNYNIKMGEILSE